MLVWVYSKCKHICLTVTPRVSVVEQDSMKLLFISKLTRLVGRLQDFYDRLCSLLCKSAEFMLLVLCKWAWCRFIPLSLTPHHASPDFQRGWWTASLRLFSATLHNKSIFLSLLIKCYDTCTVGRPVSTETLIVLYQRNILRMLQLQPAAVNHSWERVGVTAAVTRYKRCFEATLLLGSSNCQLVQT